MIIGAASGVARWFGEHVLAALPWRAVTLLDASSAVNNVEVNFACPVTRVQVGDEGPFGVSLNEPDLTVVIGVPIDTLSTVTAWLLPLLRTDATLVDLSHDRVRADELFRSFNGPALVGVHALFGISAPSADGQTFVVCPSPEAPDAHQWVSAAIEAAGGTVNELTPARHDEIMRYVQTAAHQALLGFADVIGRSGLDIEHDLWANRTPVFELLLALASRVLTPGQEATSASIQAADSGTVTQSFAEANRRLHDAQSSSQVAEHLSMLREPFPGALFTKIQQVGGLATTAVQATRAQISRQRRTSDLVGVRSIVGGERLHVGRIEKMTPTSFVLTDLLVGKQGAAALLTDERAIANARRLGIGGKTKRVEFSLGRVRILSADELEAELDQWLPTVARGCKVLVPESISGGSAVHVVESVEGVVSADLVSEEVRLGQREIVVRFSARLDRDLESIERAIQRRVDEVFVWPDGVVLPVLRSGPIGFLGPAGTFSDTAARQLARLTGDLATQRIEHVDFGPLVEAVAAGDVVLGVVPIANSSSGLVDRAAEALLATTSGFVAGGVVDVLVRFDAYVAPGTTFQPGATVYTHPQVIRQCSTFIAANNLVPVECSSTTEACRLVASQGHGVAIANIGLETEVGLELARASVGNLAGAITRFLVIGRHGTFGTSPRADDATLRSVWLAERADVVTPNASAHFDEILVGPSGRMLLVSTSHDRLTAGPGVRYLGVLPWSPRTPVVLIG
jgi:prephenate dehydratase/prephenate dehydrogenase/ferredoxin-fold anticodon binding domain-containing protein